MTDTSKDINVGTEEASTNFYWQFGKVEIFSIQTTIRGNPTPPEIDAHLASAIRAMQRVTEIGGHAKVKADGRSMESAIIPATTPTQAAIETGKAVPAPVAQPSANMISKSIDIIKVLPQPGGKVNVEFWQTGRKYAELYAKGWSIERAQKLIAPATDHNPQFPEEVPVNCTVFYTQGKEYKPGKFYEDVQFIKA